MKNFMTSIKNFIASHKMGVAIVVLSIVLIVSFIMLGNSWAYARQLKKNAEANVTALTDSVEFYKTKSGQLVAEKTLLIGDIDLLRQANKDLADEIEDMKIKNPQQVVYVETIIENEVHDTAWIVDPQLALDTTIIRDFDFGNEWRDLSGFVKLQDKDLSLTIDHDKVFVNYTLAIKDNKVYVTTDNPYVSYGNIQGLTLPNNKKMFSVGVGPTVSYGYSFNPGTPSVHVGVGLGIYYNLFQF